MSINIRKISPLKGLLTYFWYYMGGKVIIALLQAIGLGILSLFIGNAFLIGILNFTAIAMGTLTILMTMGNKEVDWERFQLSMPVRRSDLANSQYIITGATPFIGLPIVLIFGWLGSLLHCSVNFNIDSIAITVMPLLSGALIMTAFIFPLALVPALENKMDTLFWVIVLISLLIPYLIVLLANNLGWSMIIATSLMLIISITLFITSYFITKSVYAKIDF